LRREDVSHREFSNEDLSFKAVAREVDFENPFLVKTKNLIINWLLDFSIFTPIWDQLIFKRVLYHNPLFLIDYDVPVQTLNSCLKNISQNSDSLEHFFIRHLPNNYVILKKHLI
jgi:hypothetical protein